jgi:hypothetical protein
MHGWRSSCRRGRSASQRSARVRTAWRTDRMQPAPMRGVRSFHQAPPARRGRASVLVHLCQDHRARVRITSARRLRLVCVGNVALRCRLVVRGAPIASRRARSPRSRFAPSLEGPQDEAWRGDRPARPPPRTSVGLPSDVLGIGRWTHPRADACEDARGISPGSSRDG